MILAIDLGTTNSLAGIFRHGAPELIPNALGGMLTPSAVTLDDSGTPIIGQAARERLSTHPDRTVAAFKRAMGTPHTFKLGRSRFRAEELSALVLGSLKRDAERFLGETVTQAVITVPAYFSDAQRRATKTAGQLAGFDSVTLLNEPTAAALAYGLHQGSEDQRILVLDLGGGTFDVSILDMFEGVMEVRATAGDNVLGGEDFSAALMDGFLAAVGEKAGLPPRTREHAAHAALRRAAEIAKRALSDQPEHRMTLVHDKRELAWTVTRERFEELAAPLLARIRAPVERALRDAKLTPDDIDHLVLAGGATRMPVFRRLVARLFQRLPIATVNPDEVVARGAAVQAGLVAQDAALADRVMTDVAPFTMGIAVDKGEDGIILATGLYQPVIERNTVVPASRSMVLRTMSDGQRFLPVIIYQGEARHVADNIKLGELNIAVRPAPAGKAKVEVRFTYDTSGVLEVEVTMPETGAKQRLVIENQPGVLTPAEIEAALARLAPLKIHPSEQAENQAVLARAERLYAERLGTERAPIAAAIDRFQIVLRRQDPQEIAAVRAELTAWLDTIDTSVF